MKRNVLILDCEDAKAEAILIKTILGYDVWITKDVNRAQELRRERKFDALVVEPFRGDYLRLGESPNVPFARELKKEGGLVIVASTQTKSSLERDFGLTPGDYNAFFEKPYDVVEDLCPILKELLEDKT